MGVINSALRATRPKQWIKNLLVAAAPIAAGQFESQFVGIILGVIGFTAASIFGYLINDWLDRELDRKHPKKKYRPFASQELKLRALIALLIINFVIVNLICIYLPIEFFITILVYLIVTISYSVNIKKQPVLEMVWLATGFLLRAIAGSAIIQEAPTGWFIVSVSFGALFIVSTKRFAELKKNHPNATRLVISQYNENFLNFIVTTSVSITLLTYSLWVFQNYPHSILAQLTILPLTLSIFLYSWHCNHEDAESPETLIYRDKLMLFCILFVVVSMIAVIYT